MYTAASMSRDVDTKQWLSQEGFAHPEALRAALETLYASGLTREGKQRMAEPKLEPAREALAASLVLTCSAQQCQDEARGGERRRVPAQDKKHCEMCGGSDNQHAVDAFVRRAQERKMTRVVVLGGSPSTREELAALVKGRLELRTVDGTQRRTGQQARDDMAWAHLIVVWGATELAHKVSLLYTHKGEGVRVVTCPRRGISALAQAALKALG